MTKYLQNIIGRFQELKHGMIVNLEKWKSTPETPEEIDMHINEVEKMDKEIVEVKKLLAKKQETARELRDKKKTEISKIEKRAIGIHADEEEKLEAYKIKIKKSI